MDTMTAARMYAGQRGLENALTRVTYAPALARINANIARRTARPARPQRSNLSGFGESGFDASFLPPGLRRIWDILTPEQQENLVYAASSNQSFSNMGNLGDNVEYGPYGIPGVPIVPSSVIVTNPGGTWGAGETASSIANSIAQSIAAIFGGNRNVQPNLTSAQILEIERARAEAARQAGSNSELGPVRPGYMRIFGVDISHGALLVGGLAIVLLQSPGLTKKR